MEIINVIIETISKAIRVIIDKYTNFVTNIKEFIRKFNNMRKLKKCDKDPSKVKIIKVKSMDWKKIIVPQLLLTNKINNLDPKTIVYTDDNFNKLLYEQYRFNSISDLNKDYFLKDKEIKDNGVDFFENDDASIMNYLVSCINGYKKELSQLNSNVKKEMERHIDFNYRNVPEDRVNELIKYYKMYEKFYMHKLNCEIAATREVISSHMAYYKKLYGADFENKVNKEDA